MKLVRETAGCTNHPQFRGNKHVYSIVPSNEAEWELLEKADDLLGQYISHLAIRNNETGELGEVTWYQSACSQCADYVWGEACQWFVDIDQVDQFKEDWKKVKAALKEEIKAARIKAKNDE